MNDVAKLTEIHGKSMYIIALEHAVNMFEVGGIDALPMLKKRIESTKEEIEALNNTEGDK